MTIWPANHSRRPAARPAHARAAPDTAAPPDADSDVFLISLCRRGDADAFGVLVQRHEGRVRTLAARILGVHATPDDIDDLVQDIFVQVWRALPRFRGDAKFSTWLHRLATNMAIKQWHRIKRRAAVLALPDLLPSAQAALRDTAPGPDMLAEADDRLRALHRAVDALPEKQRAAVLLHYFDDCPCEEIAGLLGCSVGTVWSRLHYACRKLRTTLAWLGDDF